MDDQQIYNKGGTDEDIKQSAEQNGADLTRIDVLIDEKIEEFENRFRVGEKAWQPNYEEIQNFIRQSIQSIAEESRKEGYEKGQDDAFRGRIENMSSITIKEICEKCKIEDIKFDKQQEKSGINKYNQYQFGSNCCIGCKRDRTLKEKGIWCEICKNYQK